MVEPSDKEKSELPGCTLNYLIDLEQENERLEVENVELRRVINELKENGR